MGSIQYQKAFRKQLKKSYKGLDKNQKKYIKLKEKYEQYDKALSDFYAHCKRLKNGAVDWGQLSDTEQDLFEYWNREKDSALRAMSRLETIIDVDYTLRVYLQINTHSMSF